MSEHRMAVQRSNEGHSAGRGGADRSCQFRDYRASRRRISLKGRGAADRAANLLIRKHGSEAELEAAKRADLMLDRGDEDGRLLGTD